MKIRFGLTRVFAALMTVWLAATPVSAQDSDSPVLQRISKSQTLRVGMTGAQPPFNVKNRDGKIIGMEADLANLLAGASTRAWLLLRTPYAMA